MTNPVHDRTRDFRHALGAFPTGVTIVTTLDDLGKPVGVTASSFNSVSLTPPLVLWSLAKSAWAHGAFTSSGHFAVHVLDCNQREIATKFSRSGEDKFRDLDWERGVLDSPLVEGYAALFECSTRHQYDGGDHIILVGEVIRFYRRDVPPLLFHDGAYGQPFDSNINSLRIGPSLAGDARLAKG